MTLDTQNFKDLLLKEVSTLESELSTLGRKNPDRKGDWEAVEAEDGNDAEDGDTAEGLEQLQNNTGVLEQLEVRLKEVKSALDKIEKGNYGKCDACGGDIEEDRLGANPAAATCKAHMN